MKIELSERKQELISRITGGGRIVAAEPVQQLWSGYGLISRLYLEGGCLPQLIVKQVDLAAAGAGHPRGWSGDRSHRRKVRSYEVERHWYRAWSERVPESARIPACLACAEEDGDQSLLVLEDLDAAGFPRRVRRIRPHEIDACLHWLAAFHATFLHVKPEGLWEEGTYWHLATRPDELAALDDLPLRDAAPAIDGLLRRSPYQTIVQGDAKLENFCFSDDGRRVAAVDFQYVGGGVGVQDLTYFVGSCLREEECARQESGLLDSYFGHLRDEVSRRRTDVDPDLLEADWRRLFPVAWTDFHRFLKGWSPGHWKLTDYSERVAAAVVRELKSSGA